MNLINAHFSMESIASPEIMDFYDINTEISVTGYLSQNLPIKDNESRYSPEPMDCDDHPVLVPVPESMEVEYFFGVYPRYRVNGNHLKDTERKVNKRNAYKKIRKCYLRLQSTEMNKAFDEDKEIYEYFHYSRYPRQYLNLFNFKISSIIKIKKIVLKSMRRKCQIFEDHGLQINGNLFMESGISVLKNHEPTRELVFEDLQSDRDSLNGANQRVQEQDRYSVEDLPRCNLNERLPGNLILDYCRLILAGIHDGIYYLRLEIFKTENISIAYIPKPDVDNWVILWPVSITDGHVQLFMVYSAGRTFLLNSGRKKMKDQRMGKRLNQSFQEHFRMRFKFKMIEMYPRQGLNDCLVCVCHCINEVINLGHGYNNISQLFPEIYREIFMGIISNYLNENLSPPIPETQGIETHFAEYPNVP